MNRLVNAVIKLNGTTVDFSNVRKEILAFSRSISRSTTIEKVTPTIRNLAGAISKLSNSSEKINKFGVNFSELADGIKDFISKTSKIRKLEDTTNILNKLSNVITKLKKSGSSGDGSGIAPITLQTQKINGNLTRMAGNIGRIKRMVSLSYLMRIANMLSRIGMALYDLVKKYAEYIENINLATVAYNGLENASKSLYPFVEQISKAFGLNESEVIRSVGLFKQMANAMGLAEETGTLLSETLTKMAYDISSLYNISFERSMSVLQASLAGKKLPLLVEILIANLFNCWEILLNWLFNRKISRKVLMCRFNNDTLALIGG